MPFALDLNHAQNRLGQDQLLTLRSGLMDPDVRAAIGLYGWSARWGTLTGNDFATWLDRITGTLMLTPLPLTAAWQTTATGSYARLLKSDHTFADATKWLENNKNGTAATHLTLVDSTAGTSDRSGVTTTTWPKNRPFYISVYAHSWGSGKASLLECGWNGSATGAAGVSVRLYTDGSVEVWKDNAQVGGGSVAQQGAQAQPANASGRWVSLILIPFRKRELLVMSDLGGAFVHTFDDLVEDAPDPTITTASKFWWYVPSGRAEVEVAPLRFVTSAYRAAITSRFWKAPGSGQVPSVTVYSGSPGYGSTSVTGSVVTATDATLGFTPDGVTRDCRLRVDLTGDGEATPFVYGVLGRFGGEVVPTDDSEASDLTTRLLECTLDVPEDPAGVRLRSLLRGLDPLPANSPVRLRALLGDVTMFDGRTEPPKTARSSSDDAARLTVECRDAWKAFEQYRFTDLYPLDGLDLKEAILQVAEAAGWDRANTDVEDFAFALPGGSGRGAAGDWAVLIKTGDSAADWLNRLVDSYCPDALVTIAPSLAGPVMRIRTPDSLDAAPKVTVWRDIESAKAGLTAGGENLALAPYRVTRELRISEIEPECNQVWVQGLDRRTLRPILRTWTDFESADPALAPSLRPDNWIGELRRYGLADSVLASVESVERAALRLAKRLTVTRAVAEFESEILTDPATGLPLWRGDVVTIDGLGDWRIVSLSASFVLYAGELYPEVWIPTRYVLQRLDGDPTTNAQGCGYRSPATSLAAYAAFFSAALLPTQTLRGGAEAWYSRPPIDAAEMN